MGKAISSDLRERMVRGIARGMSWRAVAEQFEVAPSSAVRIQARFGATGSVEPAKQGRPKGSGKLGPYRDGVLTKVRAQPDITMADLANWLAQGARFDGRAIKPVQVVMPRRLHI